MTTLINPFFSVILFFIGLFFGSFANVCIYRWPRNQSIIRPVRSFCPWCKKKIRWFDNVPLISFLVLKGRCRECKGTISWKYPLVELTLSLLWIAMFSIFLKMKPEPHPIFGAGIFFLTFCLVVAFFTDLEWKIIPNQTSFLLIIAGCLISFWNPLLPGSSALQKFLEALLGLCSGGGILLLIAAGGRLYFGKEVMGWGDIKLFAGIGTFLGWPGIISATMIGTFGGGIFSVAGLIFGFVKRHQYIPFGPFLILGTLATFFLQATRSAFLPTLKLFQ